DDHAVQAGGDAEDVLDRGGVGVFVQVRVNHLGGHAVDFGQELGDQRGVQRGRHLAAAEVQFDAVAGAEYDRLRPVPGRQFGERERQLRGVECQLLPHLDGCRRDVAADRPEVHFAPPSANGWAVPSATTSRANATID